MLRLRRTRRRCDRYSRSCGRRRRSGTRLSGRRRWSGRRRCSDRRGHRLTRSGKNLAWSRRSGRNRPGGRRNRTARCQGRCNRRRCRNRRRWRGTRRWRSGSFDLLCDRWCGRRNGSCWRGGTGSYRRMDRSASTEQRRPQGKGAGLQIFGFWGFGFSLGSRRFRLCVGGGFGAARANFFVSA